jgi:predicted dienelactone hydrolase
MRLTLVGLLLLTSSALRAESRHQDPGPRPVKAVDCDWRDTKRDRPVPARIYYPGDGTDACPLIIFSHGLGAGRDNYAFLGRHWASYGYVVVHVQHAGSDYGVLTQREIGAAMLRSVANLKNSADRCYDVQFAIDQMLALNAVDGPFKGRIDPQHIGLAGHSFGGWTTLLVAGETIGADAAKAIKIPILHLAGGQDTLITIGDRGPDAHRRVYDHIKAPGQALTIFKDADHFVFGLPPRPGAKQASDERIHQLLAQVCPAFWDTWLRGDAEARQWLLSGGFAGQLGGDGTFESK